MRTRGDPQHPKCMKCRRRHPAAVVTEHEQTRRDVSQLLRDAVIGHPTLPWGCWSEETQATWGRVADAVLKWVAEQQPTEQENQP